MAKTITKEREAELIRKMLKVVLVEKKMFEITTSSNYRRKLGSIAKEFGLSIDETRELVTPIITEMFNEMVEASPLLGAAFNQQ